MEKKEQKSACLRTAAYCRVSTQSDLQDGSFETQREYYLRYIEEQPSMILAGLYADHGKSGRSIANRPAFQQMLQDCRDGKIDLILTKSISRFARNMAECISVIRELKALHIGIFFEREGIDTMTRSSELLLSILAAIAQEESDSLRKNLQWSRQRHYEMGQPWEAASYGYRSCGKSHVWKIEPREACRVRTAFYLAGICRPYREICAALNQIEANEKSNKHWNHNPVIHLLSNCVYTGNYLTNKECTYVNESGIRHGKNTGQVDQFYIEGHHAPLISSPLFDRVQELLRRHLLFSQRTRFSDDDRRFMQTSIRLTEEERKTWSSDLPAFVLFRERKETWK